MTVFIQMTVSHMSVTDVTVGLELIETDAQSYKSFYSIGSSFTTAVEQKITFLVSKVNKFLTLILNLLLIFRTAIHHIYCMSNRAKLLHICNSHMIFIEVQCISRKNSKSAAKTVVLCILNSKWVLCMPFAGYNHVLRVAPKYQ